MKKYDVVANIGKYENQQGETKYINRNVGAVIQTKEGYFKLKLDACFNPAALHKSEDGSVWLNLFEPRPRADQPIAQQTENIHDYARAKNGTATPPPVDEMEDEIPF